MAAPADKSLCILVIRSGAIGDTLMATPLLRALRRSFSGSYIGMITSASAADVVRHNPNVDDVFPFKYRHIPIWASIEKRRLIKHFRKFNVDYIISLESHPDFTTLARRIGPAKLITFDKAAGPGSTVHITPAADEHSAAVNLRAGVSIGAKGDGLTLDLFYPPDLDDLVNDRLLRSGISDTDVIIGVHAGWGARRQHPERTRLRSWPASRFAQVSRWLVENHSAKVIFTGSHNDRELNEIIGREAGISYVNAAGEYSVLETAALIDRMDVLLSVDSGPAHIAAAVGTPLVTLWGPGIFSATSPIAGSGPAVVLRSSPPCAPCYGTSQMRTCKDNICMKEISVEDVEATLSQMLSNTLTSKKRAERPVYIGLN